MQQYSTDTNNKAIFLNYTNNLSLNLNSGSFKYGQVLFWQPGE